VRNALTSAPCVSSCQSMGKRIQTQYTGIPRLVGTRRVPCNRKNRKKIDKKKVLREVAEIRSQSVEEEEKMDLLRKIAR
jgi:hypothetical protein